ncbi:MAG TPA: AraC family ligand binding domain-containing protein, partial [Kofleriaceae bacterium]|nr:AraC family ligand binding domain-containing protein [Kofleriaceae bacterium]
MFETWLWADDPDVILSCGNGYGHAFPRHWHDEIHVCAYTAGRGHLRAGGATWRIASGDLVVSPVGEVHENWVSRTDTCSFHSAYLGVDLIDAAANNVVGRSVRIVGWLHGDRGAVVRRALADVHAAQADPDRLFRDECMSRLASVIVTRCGEGQPDARRLTRERAAVR